MVLQRPVGHMGQGAYLLSHMAALFAPPGEC